MIGIIWQVVKHFHYSTKSPSKHSQSWNRRYICESIHNKFKRLCWFTFLSLKTIRWKYTFNMVWRIWGRTQWQIIRLCVIRITNNTCSFVKLSTKCFIPQTFKTFCIIYAWDTVLRACIAFIVVRIEVRWRVTLDTLSTNQFNWIRGITNWALEIWSNQTDLTFNTIW